MYCTCPTTGKMMWSGTFGAAAAAVPATRPRMAARKRAPRAVVRWRLIRERALRFASEGCEASKLFGLSRVRGHEDRGLRQASPGRKSSDRSRDEAARPLRRGRAEPV